MKIIKPNARVFAGRLDPVPLINVVFLLLIFFLICSSLVFHPGIPVELPPAVNPAMNAADKLVISLTRSGQVFFNDEPVRGMDDLERKLRERVLDDKIAAANMAGQRLSGPGDTSVRSPAVVLRADRRVPYERVVEVVSLARSLNLGVYMAAAQPQTPEKPAPKTME